MMVWGGEVYEGTAEDGGRYIFGQSTDDDGDGLSECMGDCDDASPYVYPGAPETCNGKDDDCNGLVDDDANGVDTDGDGQPNACDTCASFANPGQTPNPLACMAATLDGGECLEGRVILRHLSRPVRSRSSVSTPGCPIRSTSIFTSRAVSGSTRWRYVSTASFWRPSWSRRRLAPAVRRSTT